MSAGNSRLVPHFLSALTPQGLERAMLSNNLKDGMQYQYFSIIKDGQKWYAWFYKEAKLPKVLAQRAE